MNEAVSVIDIYEEILQGRRERFPHGTWNYMSDAIRLVKYLIEEKLRWSDQDIKENWNAKLFTKLKLAGMLHKVFKGSPYDALEATYPGQFKPWELQTTPLGFWNEKTTTEATRWLFEEKLKWSDEDILSTLDQSTFNMNGLCGMLSHIFNNSPYAAINAAYPNKFKPWEFQRVPQGYWALETGIEATKWLIEEKLKWSDEDLRKGVTQHAFIDNGLKGMLATVFNGSPYSAINAAYPNRFKPWEFKNAPINFWNMENGILATKWLIEEKLKWSDEDILKKLDVITFKENGLVGMLNHAFDNSPFKAINAAYPKKFDPRDMKTKPRSLTT